MQSIYVAIAILSLYNYIAIWPARVLTRCILGIYNELALIVFIHAQFTRTSHINYSDVCFFNLCRYISFIDDGYFRLYVIFFDSELHFCELRVIFLPNVLATAWSHYYYWTSIQINTIPLETQGNQGKLHRIYNFIDLIIYFEIYLTD